MSCVGLRALDLAGIRRDWRDCLWSFGSIEGGTGLGRYGRRIAWFVELGV